VFCTAKALFVPFPRRGEECSVEALVRDRDPCKEVTMSVRRTSLVAGPSPEYPWMTLTSSRLRSINALVHMGMAALLFGCVDVSSPALEEASNRLTDGSQAIVTRELRPAGPPTKRPWDDDAQSLDSAIAAVGGRATIGIKIPSSDRFLTQRVRSLPDAAGFDAGIRFLENSGVEVLHRMPRIGAAVVAFGDASPSSICATPKLTTLSRISQAPWHQSR
jgi:hypothetical protein